MTTIRKKQCFDLWTPPTGRGCVYGQNICFHVIVRFISIKFDRQQDYFQKKIVLTFWPPPPGVEAACKDKIIACMLLYVSFSLLWYATWPFSEEKKLFWPFDPTQGSRVWLRAKCCLYVVVHLILFNLICNMTIFWKKWFLTGSGQSQDHSDPKMVRNTPSSQDAYTHYLKYYRRYAPDTITLEARSEVKVHKVTVSWK